MEDLGNQQDDPAVLQRVLRAAKATWKLAALAAVFFLVVLSSALFLLRSSVPATVTYHARFEFKFPGVDSGRFPSGDIFALNEVIEPSIIGPIYDRFKLDEYKIDRDEFFNAFSIRPYVPQEAEITVRFQQQLADRRLTFTERERIEARLRSVLDQASRSGAEIAFSLRRTVGLPSELGKSIVQAVPLAWSQYAIERRGVLRLPSFTASEIALSTQALESASLPVGIVMLSQASNRFQARLNDGSRIAGMKTLLEPISRRSFRDLENSHHDLDVFQVSPLLGALTRYTFDQGIEDVRLLAQQRVTELRNENSLYNGISNALAANVSQFVGSIAGLKGRPEARRDGTESGSSNASSTIPQLSESFLDKLVEMSARGREADENLQRHISDLSARQLRAAEKLVGIKTELERWEGLLERLSSREERPRLDDQERTRLKGALLAAATALNSQWETLSRLEVEFAANRLSHTARLYSLFLTKPDVVRYDPFLNVTVGSLLIAASWFVFLVVWIVRATLLMAKH